jgi:hypothetical protein
VRKILVLATLLLASAVWATETGHVKSVDADPFGKACGGAEYGVFFNPDGRPFCCDTTANEWRPCPYAVEGQCDARWWGVKCDGSTDVSTEMQAAIDGCSDAGVPLILPAATDGACFLGTTTLRVDKTLTMIGGGPGSAYVRNIGPTRLRWADTHDAAMILVAGCPTDEDATRCATPRGGDTGTQINTQGHILKGFRMDTATRGQLATCGGGSARCRADGIVIDGSYSNGLCTSDGTTACEFAGDCPGVIADSCVGNGNPFPCCTGIDTGPNCNACEGNFDNDERGLADDIIIEDVVYEGAGIGIRLQGNVFKVYIRNFAAYFPGYKGVACESWHAGPGAQRCGQIYITDSHVNSSSEAYAWVDIDTANRDCVASTSPHACCTGAGTGTCECSDTTPEFCPVGYDTTFTVITGGLCQGWRCMRAQQNSVMIGTHIEGAAATPTPPSDAGCTDANVPWDCCTANLAGDGCQKIGILVDGRNHYFGGFEGFGGYNTNLQIGIAGDAGQYDNVACHIPVMSSADTGIHVTDGGGRTGHCFVQQFEATVTTNMVNDRLDTDGFDQFFIKPVTMNDNGDALVDGGLDLGGDLIVGDGTAADQTIEFDDGSSPSNATLTFVDASNALQMDRDVIVTGNDLTFGDGTAADQTITFDLDSDQTFIWDESADAFSFSKPVVFAGSGSAITAATGEDLALNVDDGQFVQPDTVVPKICANAAGTATVTIDDCNGVMWNSAVATVDTINTCNVASKGRRLTILCKDSTATVMGDATGNMNLAGNFSCTDDDVIVLICWDPGGGYAWSEVSRSVN